MEFLDYNRTIVGYHGTRLSVALDIVQRKRGFHFSRNRDDWLGHGIYFWEHAPRQVLWWAERRRLKHGWNEPVAVLGSMIRLGQCLDLLDPQNVVLVEQFHQQLSDDHQAVAVPMPKNYNMRKYLDCAVFEHAFRLLESRKDVSIDSSRAVYVPTGRNARGQSSRVWTRSWIAREAHIQISVRNPRCIVGTWLETIPNEEPTDDKAAGKPGDESPERFGAGSGDDVPGAPS